jgi:hypothetical protein
MPEPGWVSDPSGRYHQRYFDGVRWTDHVADEYGRRGVDPVDTVPRTVSGPPTGGISRPGYGDVRPPPGAGWTPAAAGESSHGLTLPGIVAMSGAAVTIIAIVALPWFRDVRVAQVGGVPLGAVLKVSWFESGWIVALVAVIVAAMAPLAPLRPAWVPSVPVGVCLVWALVGTLTIKADLPGVSISFGFFLALLGMAAVVAAPFLPSTGTRR